MTANRRRSHRWSAASMIAIVLLASGVAQASTGHTVTATSKEWTVRLWVARTTAKSGTTIPATVTVDNRTGRSANLVGCPGVVYEIGLGNAKVPNSLAVSTVLCEGTISPGVHVFHTKVQTTYQSCGGTSVPRCGNPPKMSSLPPGIYRTQIVLPGAKGFPASLRPLTITLTASS